MYIRGVLLTKDINNNVDNQNLTLVEFPTLDINKGWEIQRHLRKYVRAWQAQSIAKRIKFSRPLVQRQGATPILDRHKHYKVDQL